MDIKSIEVSAINDFVEVLRNIRRFITKHGISEFDKLIKNSEVELLDIKIDLLLSVISKKLSVETNNILTPETREDYHARKIFIIFVWKEIKLPYLEISKIIRKSNELVKDNVVWFNKLDRNKKIDKKLFFNDYDMVKSEYDKLYKEIF